MIIAFDENLRFGSATLGILLFQDIAVVPFLVVFPLVENPETNIDFSHSMQLFTQLGPAAAKALLALGTLLLAGRFGLRRYLMILFYFI